MDGIWCINLRDDAGLRLKSEAGARIVPIHSNLWVAWQFGPWVQTRKSKAKPDDLLFAEAALQSDGRYSSGLSKWFHRLLKSQGIKTKQLTFHSLRHSFIDLARMAGIEDKMIKLLVGHSLKDVTSGYGKGYSAQALHDAIEKITFPFEVPDQTGKQVV